MADDQRQQMQPPFFEQHQATMMTAIPFYGQQPNYYMSMQQQQHYQQLPPTAQQYIAPVRLPEIRSTEYSDFTEDVQDKESADHAFSEMEKNYGGSKSKAGASKRVSQNDTLMSKIATTLLCNMSTFGVVCLKKGGHKRNPAVEELISLLNQDPEDVQATNNKPLKADTIKKWIDEDGTKLALEASKIAENAERNGSEKVSGGATKVQLEWKEVMERYAALTETKESNSKPQLKVLSSSGAEAMFQQASMSSGRAKREEAVDEVMRRRRSSNTSVDGTSSGSSEPSPDKNKEEWKYPNKRLKGEGSKLDGLAESLGGVFESYKTTSTVRAQAEADEAQAKKIAAEAQRDEARAKLMEARTNSDTQLIAQIEKLTSMAENADRNGDMTTANLYRAKIAKLNQQLLDS